MVGTTTHTSTVVKFTDIITDTANLNNLPCSLRDFDVWGMLFRYNTVYSPQELNNKAQRLQLLQSAPRYSKLHHPLFLLLTVTYNYMFGSGTVYNFTTDYSSTFKLAPFLFDCWPIPPKSLPFSSQFTIQSFHFRFV